MSKTFAGTFAPINEVKLTGISSIVNEIHMGSFPHPIQYFAAAGENDDFVITVINFQPNQYFENFFATYSGLQASRFRI